MNQALQNTIAFHVDEGYALEALTDEERATLVRGSETLHLRLDGSTVYLARTTAPAPASIATIVPPRRRRGRLLAVLALSGAVIVAVAIAAVSLNSDGAPASPATATPAAATAAATTPSGTATSPATSTPGNGSSSSSDGSATATATTEPGPVGPAGTLKVGMPRIAAGASRVVVAEASHAAPYFVVVYEGDESTFARAIAQSAQQPAGPGANIVIELPRATRPGEQLWLVLHRDEDRDGRFDGALDTVVTDAQTGVPSLGGVVAFRISVDDAPSPPASGNAGLAADHAADAISKRASASPCAVTGH